MQVTITDTYSNEPKNIWMWQWIKELNFMQKIVSIWCLSVSFQNHYITSDHVYCLQRAINNYYNFVIYGYVYA